ncbi:signal transduction histidine kinase [Rhodococcus sp. LBL1]|nr:signal transduction histidine kinase [Rhodococcus sp. LBL1]MDH6681447.1 signal transduction histidine kinase [Rhodococcus sp. LBL2]
MNVLERYQVRLAPLLPRIRDITLILTTTTILVGRFVVSGDHPVLGFWATSVSVVAATTLWWRRQYPIAIACVGVLVCAVSGSNVMMMLAICTLAVRRHDRWLWAVAAIGVLTNATSGFLRAGTDSYLSYLGSSLFSVFTYVVLGAYIGLRRKHLEGLHERVRHAEAEREVRAAQARLAERSRIAREMHDVVAHKVSLIALHAGALQVTAAPDAARVHRSAELIADTARAALTDLRSVLGVLRDSSDEDHPDPPQPRLVDLPALVAASREAGIPIAENISADLGSPAPSVLALAAYRVTQEALTNIHKHAAGASTTVEIHGRPGGSLTIEVVNSAPADPATPSGLTGSGAGLVGLRERVGLASGTLEHGPTPDGGWRVFASSPWPDDQSGSASN